MTPINFSGLYRITGDSKMKVYAESAKIQMKEPFKAAARDGKDMVLLTQKDAANFMKVAFNLDTPKGMEDWTVQDWVNPKNLSQVVEFGQVAAKTMAGQGVANVKAIESKIVTYFKALEDAGADIKKINV